MWMKKHQEDISNWENVFSVTLGKGKKELLKLEVRTEKVFLSQMTGFVGHKE